MNTKLLTSGFFILLIAGYFAFSENSLPELVYKGEKMRGLSFVAPDRPIDETHIRATDRVNADWAALMPYGFVKEGEAVLRYTKVSDAENENHQWWGEQPNGIVKCIQLAHSEGKKVMLKPHIWHSRGNYTGDLELTSEEDWKAFEESFGAYILQYASIAEEQKVELFCIATEMKSMVAERPDFWVKLIRDIKKVYNGPLTYAENWDCFDDVPFWQELDFIGIDGYFPLSDKQSPDLKILKEGWSKHLRKMSRYASRIQKPILFTEYGFRSCDFATEKPWETDYSLPDNEGLQARAYQSLYNEVWQQPWFAGGFAWKWFPFKELDKASRDKFCPQHKLAENVIRDFYSLN
jgi:hypothetical protein